MIKLKKYIPEHIYKVGFVDVHASPKAFDILVKESLLADTLKTYYDEYECRLQFIVRVDTS